MSITFPRAFPSTLARSTDFEIERQEAVAPEAGGRLISVEIGWPRWALRFSTTPGNEAEFDKWRAWLASLKGSRKMFLARDLRRGPYPRLYKTGFTGLVRAGTSDPFDGTATSWSGSVDEPSLAGLPDGFIVSEGDYLGFQWGSASARTLHRVVQGGTADISGDLDLVVEPEIPAFVPSDATATFNAPTCLMRVRPGSLELSADVKDRRVSFEAVQLFIAPPYGYTIAFDAAGYTEGVDDDDVTISVSDAEWLSIYDLTISSSGGGTPVTATGAVASGDFDITGLDLTGLNAGTLTASLTLTNNDGEGIAAEDTATLS